MNEIFLKRFQERKQHAEIQQLKQDLIDLNKDYTDMAAEVQKNDQGNDRLSFVRSNPFLRIEEKQNLG